MRLPTRLVLAVLLLGGVGYGQSRPPVGHGTGLTARREPTRRRPKYVPDQLLVRFRRGVSKSTKQAEHAQIGAQILKEFHVVENLQLVRLPAGQPLKQAVRYYRQRPDVLYAEPNYYRYADQSPVTPSDPRFAEMWNLHNTGQSGGTPGADLHAPEAWALSTGSAEVVVGIIDTGIDYNHADLAANMFQNSADCNSNGLDDDGNGYVDDCYGIDTANNDSNPMDDDGHGTHVAGTIGAEGNNGIGVVGVNWTVRLLACKFLDSNGAGNDADAITCLDYMARMKDRGVNIVATNNSWGGGGFSQALFDAIDAQRRRGILFIAAAGNGGVNNDFLSFYPANYQLPNVIAVAATDRMDGLASFSDFGRHTVHLGAPGVDILSTVPAALFDDPYFVASGTSMATPHVTGVAALLAAQDPIRDWKAIKNLILSGGDAIPSVANTISQRRLNAYGALSCSNSPLYTRLRPADSDAYVSPGDTLNFTVLSINCAASNGPVQAILDGGTETITLADDGVGPDQAAGDGIFVAQRQWSESEIGDHTLVFSGNDVLTVHVLPPLPPYSYSTAVPFQYRTITGTDLLLGDDDSAVIQPPFPVQFGGVSFPTLNVNSNGNVTFTGPFIEWENTPLPAAGTPTLVAAFWDDLGPFGTYKIGRVRWDVLGTAPNRELVIEWRDAYNIACWMPKAEATFQMVFFEGSSDILFNYADVMFGLFNPLDPMDLCTEEVNAGASATVGVQTRRDLANQFSFNTRSLTDNSSILWQVGDLTPAITRLSPLSALAGAPALTLRVLGRSFLPGANVRWNGSDRTTTFVHTGELDAVIAASDLAAQGTAQVTVFQPSPYSTGESAPAPFDVYSSNPVPTLTGMAPDPISLDSGTTLTLNGTGFVFNSVALWNGIGRATTAISSTQLQVTVRLRDIEAGGTAQMAVFNPGPGGGTSNPLTVHISNLVPDVGFLVPPYVGAGNPGITVRVWGYGFAPASVVRWNGSDRHTTFGSMAYLDVAIPASDIASTGTAHVSVFTPAPGGGIADPVPFSILVPPANDRFANATLIGALPFTQTQDAKGATTDAFDPQPPCVFPPPQESVWFRITPAAAGTALIADTFGSNYALTVLSAWTGAPGSFVNLGCKWGWETDGVQPGLGIIAPSTAPVYFMVSTAMITDARTLVFNLNEGPGFTLGASPKTSSVQRGSTASYTITVTPSSGSFNDPIALSCSVAPVGPACSLSPASVTPGSTPASVTLSVSTTNVTARVEHDGPAPLFAFVLALPLIGLLAARRFLPGRRRARFGIFLALVLMAATLGVQVGCNGGGGSSSSPPPSKSQTYTITVTGTSGAISQQISTSLTVTF